MVDPLQVPEHSDIRSAREQFPATENSSYFNTATLGLASRRLTATLHAALDDWAAHGFDYDTAERAGERARSRVARMIGTDAANIAQISSVSGMAGFVATQLPPARPGDNIVIGEREFSSNHFPWRMLAERGYEVRQVPFRHGGLEPDDVGSLVDGSRLTSICSTRAEVSGTATSRRRCRTGSTRFRRAGRRAESPMGASSDRRWTSPRLPRGSTPR